MDPMTIALLMGGGAAAGSFFGAQQTNQANQDIAKMTNEFSAQQTAINREWQERMSNTSYQRAMADMRKAGLNPMLAFSQGGAAVPSGGAPQGVMNRNENAVGAGINSAATAMNTANALNAQRSQQGLQAAQSTQAVAQANKSEAEKTSIMDDNARKAGMYPSAKSIQERNNRLDEKHLDRERIMNQIQTGTSSARDVIRALTPMKIEMPGGKPPGGKAPVLRPYELRRDRKNPRYWGENP